MTAPLHAAVDVRWRLPPATKNVLVACMALGAAAFAYGLFLGDAARAWAALLVNFLFWSGLAHAGVLLSALQTVTSARWGRALKRMAEATCAFLPLAFLVLVVLLAGASSWVPWATAPVEAKQSWLNVPFLAARQIVSFLALSALGLAYVYHSVRPDLGLLSETARPAAGTWQARLIARWRGIAIEQASSSRGQKNLAPVLVIAYALVLTLQAFDLVMSLEPHWFSTLFGGYFFIGNLYLGLAFLAVVTVWSRSQPQLSEWVGTPHLHDVGKLLFGFAILWAYLAWSQYFVIWYGDLPEETAFVSRRMVDQPWAPISWIVVLSAFVIPFAVLLSRAAKRQPRSLLTIAVIVLAGMWLERFVLVAPSLWHGPWLPLGVLEVFVTAGFGASFLLCYFAFLGAVPVVPISDPLLAAAPAEHGHTGPSV